MSKEFVMTLKTDDPICIDTPAGMIEIHSVVQDGQHAKASRRKLKFVVPDVCHAAVGRDRVLDRSTFLKTRDDGAIQPTFKTLVPVWDNEGNFIGVTEPSGFILREPSVGVDTGLEAGETTPTKEETQDEHGHIGTDEVADVESPDSSRGHPVVGVQAQ